MTLDSLVAVIGLLIAAYQIMPRERQFELALRFERFERIIITLALALILYLQFFSFFEVIGWTPGFGLQRWNITPERASFLVVLATALTAYSRLRFTKLSPKRIGKFARLVDELTYTKNYPQLLSLLERHLTRLTQIAQDSFQTSMFRRRHLDPTYTFANPMRRLEAATSQPPKSLLESIEKKVPLGWLARFTPDRTRESTIAKNLFRKLLTSREFSRNLVTTKPYFGLSLLNLKLSEVRDFHHLYFRALLTEPSSVLFYELRNSQRPNDGWYDISSSDQILNFFFTDAKVAEEHSVWSPIGEATISELDRLGRERETDPYNLQPDRDFRENAIWESSLFAVVSLFDIMVTQALRQGIQWHMWLYYFSHFVPRIIRNYIPRDPERADDFEFPTRYELLLHQMFSTMRDWVNSVRLVPADQENVRLRNRTADHENGNIPKSAIKTMAFCLRDLLLSEKISAKLKESVIHMVYGLFLELRPAHVEYAEVLLVVITPPRGFVVVGGEAMYWEALKDAYDSFDRFPHNRDHLEELRTAITRV